jgi:hypothetical protein
VTAQRQKKLEFEYSLGYVIEERFYAIAPCGAREDIDELCLDLESFEDFVSAVPEKYKDFCKQAIREIRDLYISNKLPAVSHKEDADKPKPLLAKWNKDQLSPQEAMSLVDMLYITGQQLYKCDALPEWKDYIDRYQNYMFGDEDERFRHTYAVLEDYNGVWVDKNGYYKGPPKPSEFVSRDTELLLGLINDDDQVEKSIRSAGIELNDKLDTAEQNIRMFFAVKAVLDAAMEAVGLDTPDKGSVLIFPYIRISALIKLYNLRLEYLQQERMPWESSDTRLEKALKTLSPIDSEKLKPSPDCLKQLKNDILKDTKGEEWLRTKLLSVECGDGFNFKEMCNE